MAEIFRNPALPDYFESVDYRDKADFARLPDLYENEKVILLQNKRVDFDADFFSRVTLAGDRGYKKFKTVQFVEGLKRGENIYPTLAADCFGGDEGRAAYFGKQVTSIFNQVTAILAEAAPGYKITQPRLTLRCSPTFNENLHMDVYNEDIPTHHFRLFVNLDSAHRIWRTSWRLSDTLGRLGELPAEDLGALSSGALLKALNFHIFGGYDLAFEDRGEPTHTAFFEPGEIWFVDSRKIAHQIFYGQRAISSESVVEPENMVSPANHYLTIAQRARRNLLGLAA